MRRFRTIRSSDPRHVSLIFTDELDRFSRQRQQERQKKEKFQQNPFIFFMTFIVANIGEFPSRNDVKKTPIYKLITACDDWLQTTDTRRIEDVPLFRQTLASLKHEYKLYKARLGRMRYYWFQFLDVNNSHSSRNSTAWTDYLATLTIGNAFTNSVVTVTDDSYHEFTGRYKEFTASEIAEGFMVMRNNPNAASLHDPSQGGYKNGYQATGGKFRVHPYKNGNQNGNRPSERDGNVSNTREVVRRGLSAFKYRATRQQAIEFDQICFRTLTAIQSDIKIAYGKIDQDGCQYCEPFSTHMQLLVTGSEFHERVVAHSAQEPYSAFIQFLDMTQETTEGERRDALALFKTLATEQNLAQFRAWNAAECRRQWLSQLNYVMSQAHIQFERLEKLSYAIDSSPSPTKKTKQNSNSNDDNDDDDDEDEDGMTTMLRFLKTSQLDITRRSSHAQGIRKKIDMQPWRERLAHTALIIDCCNYNLWNIDALREALVPFASTKDHGAWRKVVADILRVPETGIHPPPSTTIDKIENLEKQTCVQSAEDAKEDRRRFMYSLVKLKTAVESLLTMRRATGNASTAAELESSESDRMAMVEHINRRIGDGKDSGRLSQAAHRKFVKATRDLLATTRETRLVEARLYLRDAEAIQYLQHTVLSQPIPQRFAWYLEALEHMTRLEHVMKLQHRFASVRPSQ